MIGQSNHEAHTKNKANVADIDSSLNDTNDPTQDSGSQVDMHTFDKNISSKVRSGVYGAMKTVEARVQDAVLTAIENLVVPRVELAMESVNASSGHGVGRALLGPDQRDFSGNIEGL